MEETIFAHRPEKNLILAAKSNASMAITPCHGGAWRHSLREVFTNWDALLEVWGNGAQRRSRVPSWHPWLPGSPRTGPSPGAGGSPQPLAVPTSLSPTALPVAASTARGAGLVPPDVFQTGQPPGAEGGRAAAQTPPGTLKRHFVPGGRISIVAPRQAAGRRRGAVRRRAPGGGRRRSLLGVSAALPAPSLCLHDPQ